jgi:hypothetical protein
VDEQSPLLLLPQPRHPPQAEPGMALAKATLAMGWAESRVRGPAWLEMAAGLEEILQGLRSRTGSR